MNPAERAAAQADDGRRTLVPAMRQSSGSGPATLVRGSSATNNDPVGERLRWRSRSPNIRLINRRTSSPGLLSGLLESRVTQELRI
jgi:hypothetical protein